MRQFTLKTSGDSHLLLFTTYSIMEQILLWLHYQDCYDIEDYIWIILTKVWDMLFKKWAEM